MIEVVSDLQQDGYQMCIDNETIEPMTKYEWTIFKAKKRIIYNHFNWVQNVMLPYMEECKTKK